MNMLNHEIRVAIFDDFLEAFSKIPRAQQKKVNSFIRKFRLDPTAKSINYEPIHDFVDKNLRTVRIDQAYRAIVLRPDAGNVYVLLWVDHHDDAMAWAKNKKVSIHPETGALQMLAADKVTAAVQEVEAAETSAAEPLFEALRDRELSRLGVPEEMVPAVRTVTGMDGLDALRATLPAEAYESLFYLAEGEPYEEVVKAAELAAANSEHKEASIDVEDFAAALERGATKRRFVVIHDDEELEAMLDAPLEKWRVFLHPSQRRLVERSWNGPVRVLGGAGTGKTVVAMHRAVYLARKLFSQPTERVLFTTFTTNLAADIRANLEKLCGPEVLERIKVTHLDALVGELLKGAGYDYRIAYWGGSSRLLEKYWDEAMALGDTSSVPASFYRDEWSMVVQPQGCLSWEDYKQAKRTGRGVRLSRAQRKRHWEVFDEYRTLLEQHRLREPEDAMRDVTQMIAAGKITANYQTVLVDEAQDMSTAAFSLLRTLVPVGANDMFVVGDGHQRIYRKKVVLGRAGVKIVGRSHRLKVNYRTTDEIRRFAVALLEGVEVDDLDSGVDTSKGYKSLMHGEPPEVRVFETFEQEVDALVAWITADDPSTACVVTRTNKARNLYQDILQARGLEVHAVKRSARDDRSRPGVRIATMHRVKGLEFERVAICGANDADVPLATALASSVDKEVRSDIEQIERSLLYVALTRAKKAALVTAHGKLSRWL